MSTPILRRRRVLAAKIEATPGVAESLTGSDGVFNVFDSNVNPTIEMIQRDGQGVFSPLPGVLGARGGTASFSIHAIGGDPLPAWATTFLPACGLVATSDVYAPVSAPPGTAAGVKTITIGSYQDGMFKRLRGCMGTALFTFIAGQPVAVAFTFTGLWDTPSDVALIAPNYPNILPPRFADAGLTIGGSLWSPKISQMTLDLGNTVILREDPSDITGYCTALITNRRINGTLDPESSLVATNDTYGDWLDSSESALSLSFGEAGNRIAVAAPKWQIVNPQEGNRNDVQIDTIEYQLNRDADAGDDELEITLD